MKKKRKLKQRDMIKQYLFVHGETSYYFYDGRKVFEKSVDGRRIVRLIIASYFDNVSFEF